MKRLGLIISLFLLVLATLSPKETFAAPGDCCTTNAQCDLAAFETCTGTGYACGRRNPPQRSCVRPAPQPTPDTVSCPASHPYPYTGTPPSSLSCVSGGRTGSVQLLFCCQARPTVNPQGSPFSPGTGTGQASTTNPFCGGGTSEVDTAIGCIPTSFTGLFDRFFTLGIGIAGGIAFLLILFGGFQILTSAGNPEQLAAGKELVQSAITGLLMIIFSVFLLQVIGVDILRIPGFTK